MYIQCLMFTPSQPAVASAKACIAAVVGSLCKLGVTFNVCYRQPNIIIHV